MQLIKPSVEYKDSFLEMVREFQADPDAHFYEGMNGLTVEDIEANFDEYIEKLHKNALGQDLPEGYVPSSVFWLVDQGEVAGHVSVRHELSPKLLAYGGHIGYGIRPKYRGKGYGTKILELALKESKQLNIKKILVMCDKNNLSSKRIIEKNGGIFEGESTKPDSDDKIILRYWITL